MNRISWSNKPMRLTSYELNKFKKLYILETSSRENASQVIGFCSNFVMKQTRFNS